MQSVYVVRLLLNGLTSLLVLKASSLSAWSVVEPVGLYEQNLGNAISATQSELVSLRFSPNEYCLDFGNGTNACHPYAYLLTHSEEPLNTTALHGGIDPQVLLAASSTNRLKSAVSGWCMGASSSTTSSSSSKNDGAWFLQGAQSVMCLVVLETCLYTKLLWLFFAFLSTAFSLGTAAKWSKLEGCASFTTFAQTSLGILLLLEWWGYSVYMMDLGVMAMLQLVVHYGVSMHYVLFAMSAALVACHASAQISNPLSSLNMAKLHALPARLRPRRGRGSPREGDSPESNEDPARGCLEEEVDPLHCPANYHV